MDTDEIRGFIDLVRKLRHAQQSVDGNRIRELTLAIDERLNFLLPLQEAGGGAKTPSLMDELIAFAEEAAACLAFQKKYAEKKDHQTLTECRDRERRLTQRCRDVLSRRPKPKGLFERYEEAKAAKGVVA